MPKICDTNIYQQSVMFKAQNKEALSQEQNINAHYSADMKVKKPKVSITNGPPELPKHNLLSHKETEQKMQKINTDIYEGYKKEKKDNGLNFSKFLKIFSTIGILAIIIACIRKNKGGK